MVQQKKIVDQVSGWMTLYDDGSVDRTWTGPPEVKFMSDTVPPHDNFVDGVAVADVTSDQLKLRIYLPERDENDVEKLPILLHFHGGGFCISEADWFMYYSSITRLMQASTAPVVVGTGSDDSENRVASTAPVVIVAGSNRLEASAVPVIIVSVYLPRAPERRLPAACDEGYAALRWLRSVAAGESDQAWLRDHGDFNRVFLIGDSSGGNIVHQVAARAGNEDLHPLKLAGAIPIHPGFCRATRSKSELEQPETPFLTLDMVDKFLNLALPIGATKDHPITCPMNEALDELKLPPYLYCVADQDLLKDTEMEFYEAMKGAKKEVELFVSHGVGHSYYLNKLAVDYDPVTGAETEKLFQKIKEFVNEH